MKYPFNSPVFVTLKVSIRKVAPNAFENAKGPSPWELSRPLVWSQSKRYGQIDQGRHLLVCLGILDFKLWISFHGRDVEDWFSSDILTIVH